MRYVLSVVRPPEEGAAFGRATVLDPTFRRSVVRRRVVYILTADFSIPEREAEDFALALISELTSTERVHTGTGLVFRIYLETRAPHPCPCCDRLVLPTDHAYAATEDAFCLGCFTWRRGTTACLPENTAHTKET